MSNRLFPIVSEKKEGGTSSCSVNSVNVMPVADSASVHASPGFAGNVALVTLGCAKNLVDSEVMLGVLQSKGFRSVPEAEAADLIIVNTCAFLQSAVEEGLDTILDLQQFKKSGRCKKLIVAGCMVERYRKELEEALPEVDRFISTDELLTVADEGNTTAAAIDSARRPYFLYDESMPRVISTQGSSAYIKIAEGCDRPCAFCIIPKIRGEFRSRPVSSVLTEAKQLVDGGVKELNLVAQDLTAYGIDFEEGKRGKPKLLELLESFAGMKGDKDFWVRLLYAYPIGVTEELLRAIVASPVICNYLDLPLQHISNAVLKRMNRPLGERGTRGLIEQMHKLTPEIALRTTFILGFPGETEEDVRSLEEFVSSGFFTHVGVFPYSQEPESKAYVFEDQVPDELKQERVQRIMDCQKQIVRKRNESLLGKELKVLVEGYHEESDLLLSARAEWQAPEIDGVVIINDVEESLRDENGEMNESLLRGRFGLATVTEATDYDLVATLQKIY